MTTQLKCQFFKDGSANAAVRVFDQDVVKVGSLPSAHLCFPNIARMHAVLNREESGEWRVIDLGSALETRLDGSLVDKNAVLGRKGVLRFGDWSVEFEVEGESQQEKPKEGNGRSTLDDAFRGIEKLRVLFDRPPKEEREHHKKLAESLFAELERLVPDNPRLRSLAAIVEMWETQADAAGKRELLRSMVAAIREVRRGRQSVSDAISAVSPDVVRQIYDLTPDQAYKRVRMYLDKLVLAKQGREVLGEMGLPQLLKETIQEERRKGDEEEVKRSEDVLQMSRQLMRNLQREEATTVMLMVLSMGRAAGHSLTDDQIQEELERLKTRS